MGNLAPRVRIVGRSGPDPEIQITPEAFSKLEKILRMSLSDEARTALAQVCNKYLFWRATELRAAPFSEVEKLFGRLKQAIESFREFSSEMRIPHSDAGSELNGLWSYHLSRSPFAIYSSDIFNPDDAIKSDGDESHAPLGSREHRYVRLNNENLMRIGLALHSAMKNAENEIERRARGDDGMGFLPGDAYKVFLIELKGWAREYRIPRTSRSNYGTTAFCKFAFELNNVIAAAPDLTHLAAKIKSAAAIGDHLRPGRRRRGK